MLSTIHLVLLALGGLAGFMAGLLGIGGAIILVPMLMYIPPMFGEELSFHTITGISMTQVFFAALTGMLIHAKGGNIRWNLVLLIGGFMLTGSFVGSIASNYLPEKTLKIVFAAVLAISMLMLMQARRDEGEEQEEAGKVNTYAETSQKKIIAGVMGLVIGLLSGMVGVGGAAFITPSMNYFLNVPIKLCIGTSLGIILAGGAAGFLGKAITGQVAFDLALYIVIGAILGSQLGSRVSMKLPGEQLRKILVFVLFLVLCRIVLNIFHL